MIDCAKSLGREIKTCTRDDCVCKDQHDFRDRGDPMEKRYDPNNWREWEHNPDMDVNLRGRRY